MKTSFIIIGIIFLVFLAFQVWASMSTNKTEQYKYTVLRASKTFEVRKYEKAVFARTQIDSETYRSGSGNGFRTLASYIFGGNDRNESIAMTSPVAMSWDEGMTMEFMMPSKYTLESLPNPNRKDIQIYEKPAVVMAAISFGGFASDDKIQEKIKELKKLLDDAGIAHTGQFQYMGYNPPYQMINRRNDIVVELIDWKE
ncbi:MAG: heme-binding protein [Bacteroidales bacterium]|nr:heme-binding protein [Bacteroidales bacterium]